ncbi:MAG TPA: LysM peptidoglycan-binding domain-containing protein [Acidimicrobiales bacterium]|nr:LysM peptidoglycan-binding domain-containing protein [Acidimicrobiales bacterium]
MSMSAGAGAGAAASAAGSLVSAYIQILPPGEGQIDFQVNPNQYHVTKQAHWKEDAQTASSEAGAQQFQGTQARSLSLTLFLDSSLTPPFNVTPKIQMLLSTCDPTTASIEDGNPAPPEILFGWGLTEPFRGYITSVDVTYSLFRLGTPIRAEANVSITEVPLPLPGTNPTSGGLATRRTHTVVAGDTLASVAQKEYGRPALWRPLADLNGIDDPTRLRPGTVLIVPERSEVEKLA